jgi:hypothetical protein
VICNTAIGIGVRTSVYIQAFLPLIPLVVQVGAGVKLFKITELRENASQSIIFFATHWHGTCHLCDHSTTYLWFECLSRTHCAQSLLDYSTLVGSIAPCYLFVALQDSSWMLTLRDGKLMSRYTAALIAKPMLTGGLGLWLTSKIWTFDTTLGACMHVLDGLLHPGHLVHVTDRSLHRAMLALYAILLIPLMNVFIVMLFFLVWFVLATIFIVIFLGITYRFGCRSCTSCTSSYAMSSISRDVARPRVVTRTPYAPDARMP